MTCLLLYPRNCRGSAHQIWPPRDTLPKGFVQETKEYIFELTELQNVLRSEVYVDDVPLEALRPMDESTAVWRWLPGFHAGLVEIAFTEDGQRRHSLELVTDPDLDKLTRTEFATMVSEILQDSLALFSVSSFRQGIASSTLTSPPPIARLEYLRSRLQDLKAVIGAIANAPRRILRGKEVTRPYHKASGVKGPEILRSFRTGRVHRSTDGRSRLPKQLNGCLPANITQRVTFADLDIKEHREIKSALCRWATWLGSVADILRERELPEEVGRDSQRLRLAWARRTRMMSYEIRRLLDLPLFSDVTDSPDLPRLSSIYRNDPKYRAFFKLHRQFNLGLANVFGDFLQMPLAQTFDLYELWCFFRILRVSVDRIGIDPRELDGLFEYLPTTGAVAVEARAVNIRLITGAILSFQRRYREYWLESEGPGSFSRQMIPDISLSLGRSVDRQTLVVLDAKYRINKGLNEALASIHMYRDALVCAEGEDVVSSAVRAAYLLSPHIPVLVEGEGWKDTGLPGRLFHPTYRKKFRFGAATLKPGMSENEIWQTIQRILNDAGEAEIEAAGE